jgi:hypothetical protein
MLDGVKQIRDGGDTGETVKWGKKGTKDPDQDPRTQKENSPQPLNNQQPNFTTQHPAPWVK